MRKISKKTFEISRLNARQICSIGFKSGEYAGRKTSKMFYSSANSLTNLDRCDEKLSNIKTILLLGLALINSAKTLQISFFLD